MYLRALAAQCPLGWGRQQARSVHDTHAEEEWMAALRDLPALDLLKGFDAAARHLSFTRAAAELFLTQSAISRQVQALEDQLGVRLFERRTRALVLTDAGARYHRAVRTALDDLRAATAAVRAEPAVRPLTVTTTITFASLWLVPRLADFHAAHPELQVRLVAENRLHDLDREGIDVAIRYSTAALAGADAERLFGERVLPVASPGLAAKSRLKTVADLARCALLDYDDAGLTPWLTWRVWFETARLPLPATAGILRFNHYDQLIQAAVAGQGVALGRMPLVDELLRKRQLVAPFGRRNATPAQARAYHVLVAPGSRDRPEARAFVDWLRDTVAAWPPRKTAR
jgi:DNA-binding transcriptional LysR family regulator